MNWHSTKNQQMYYRFSKVIKLFFILFIFIMILNISLLFDGKTKQKVERKEKKYQKQEPQTTTTTQFHLETIQKEENFINKISIERLNKLFQILFDNEQKQHPKLTQILKQLEVISFNNLIKTNQNGDYFQIIDNKVQIQQKFIDNLISMSNFYSFHNSNYNNNTKPVLNDNKVIVTAADSGYYGPMQASLFHIHKQFPNHKIIVYDLGLTPDQVEKTKQKCKCQIKQFNINGIYSNISAHISNLRTYSWKPLIIQETLKNYETVIYIDSSIRFKASNLNPILKRVQTVGLLTQFIQLNFLCYTNEKIFDWFKETSNSFIDFYTIEANILIFQNNFLTSLIMKAWVQCALSQSCISPEGSRTGACCGCHRYDQTALTIISSYFYGIPKNKTFNLPAFSFTKDESYFFEIKRYETMRYF
jgi:hypothetical protein